MDLAKARPMLDELKKGQWPSFVKEIEKSAAKNEQAATLLDLLEDSYEEKRVHWKHGGIVGVRGYGGGVIGRYTDSPEKYPAVTEFHTVRVNQTSGWFYNSSDIRTLCDIWEKHGSGLTNMHGATGDIVFLGTTTDQLQETFNDLSYAGWDLGGSGSNFRTPSCCVGPGRCEYACFDTLDFLYNITQEYQTELHRPMWPYKSKIKVSGCPNDCIASQARADISVLGTWRDAIQIDQAEAVFYNLTADLIFMVGVQIVVGLDRNLFFQIIFFLIDKIINFLTNLRRNFISEIVDRSSPFFCEIIKRTIMCQLNFQKPGIR